MHENPNMQENLSPIQAILLETLSIPLTCVTTYKHWTHDSLEDECNHECNQRE
jgi:hypothetical protein